jgi:type II secretory pathway pseudopilin PulG
VSPTELQQPTAEPEPTESTATARNWRLIAIAGALVVVLLVAAVIVLVAVRGRSSDDARAQLAERQAQVEQKGAQVMPFDQNLTTHRFTKTNTGGVETVTANDPNDTTQAALVQGHLQHEQELFSAGDFSDPMAIHGMAMPGIDALKQGATQGDLTVTYEALPAGAQLTYTATTPELVSALHAWFDAQLMDHGSHATG